jgi:uncharacterized membrane protein HdeD (DUF308 family)
MKPKSGIINMLRSGALTRDDAGYGILLLSLSVLCFVAPFLNDAGPIPLVGLLMVVAGVVSLFHSLRRAAGGSFRSMYGTGGLTLLIGILLLAAPAFAGGALRIFVGAVFLVDGVRRGIDIFRKGQEQERWRNILAGLANLVVALVVFLPTQQSLVWTIAIAGGLRVLGTAWDLVTATVYGTADAGDTVLRDLGIADDPGVHVAVKRMVDEEQARRPIDLAWILTLVVTLMAIHIGRMESEWTLAGLLSPFVALIGDLFVALVAAFLIIVPLRLFFARATRGLERRLWAWMMANPSRTGSRGFARRVAQWWLNRRLRYAVRIRQARYSIGAALVRGLTTGLPVAAMLTATVPIWGMSWYFDTENWAAGIYNSWAENRTDTWRMAMIQEVRAAMPGPASEDFVINAPTGEGDFSFIVIGDPGEGDASQHILRHQLVQVANQEDVRFVLISSDVVYPTGAMKDYEANFWLPFHGIQKPVYAIPGNHDWYDALEGFAATFFEADAARSAMRARLVADSRISGTTEGRIEELIAGAARLRSWYGVPTGFQRAPFFQIQTPHFGLITVDTGVLRRVDSLEFKWLRSALEKSRGKTTMVVLGHPLYALGGYDAEERPAFREIHELLKSYGVTIAMGGDTHDFEYYRERYQRDGKDMTMHHFVNGGGGAYLSMGTALSWPDRPPVDDWGFYPSRQELLSKTDRLTPWYKWPAWVWVKKYRAWPYSVEWLSAAFDYNVSPFFQSFVVVRVEPSHNRLRIIPYTASGRMTWAEFQHSLTLHAQEDPGLVEFVFPMGRSDQE